MKLPQISGKELVQKLKRLGFVVIRQRGSHIRIEKNIGEDIIKITIPNHPLIKKGTLNKIIKESRLTKEEIFS